MERQLVYNAVKCLDCGEILHSKYNHDYQRCECGSFTDGGTSYQRYGGNVELLSLYSDAPHEEIRDLMVWGQNFDENKNLLPETVWKPISTLDQGHLEALVDYTEGKWIQEIFKNEVLWRKNNS